VVLSYELEQFMGRRIVPRTAVTKQVWAYIRENKLQNPKNGREILCDSVLEKFLKRKKLTMFQMTKILSSVSEIASTCS
jgi:upstream activation factor subunit UAF30